MMTTLAIQRVVTERVGDVADAVEPVMVLASVEVDGDGVRWERILALRGQIAAGTYRVASQAVAETVMDAMMR